MASIMVSIIIDNLEEDTDMEKFAESIVRAVQDDCPYHDVTMNEWECN